MNNCWPLLLPSVSEGELSFAEFSIPVYTTLTILSWCLTPLTEALCTRTGMSRNPKCVFLFWYLALRRVWISLTTYASDVISLLKNLRKVMLEIYASCRSLLCALLQSALTPGLYHFGFIGSSTYTSLSPHSSPTHCLNNVTLKTHLSILSSQISQVCRSVCLYHHIVLVTLTSFRHLNLILLHF